VTYEPVTLGKSVWLPWRVFVMPGSTIGDGTVIGANSLVSGTIPPNSLAVGSPAKVIRSAPDFPQRLDDTQRAQLVRDMMEEFDRFVGYQGVTLTVENSLRLYRYEGRVSRLHWRSRDGSTASAQGGDTLLSETALSETERSDYRKRGVFWLDLAGRTRSLDGSPFTEELAQFLGRYGIRLERDGKGR
jgi:hypothetical protein